MTRRRASRYRAQRCKTQRRHRRQRGGDYSDPAYATTETIGGVPITRNPVVVLGNRVLSLKDYKDYVERGATEQIGPDE